MSAHPSEEEVLLRTQRFDVVRLEQVTRTGEVRFREVIRHPGSAVILPLVDENTVCLIRNYRPALGQSLIELPAGTLQRGEDPLVAAQRELIEETGFRPQRLQRLQSFYSTPGILDEQMTLFLATGLTPGDPEREVGETIENVVVSWQAAMEMVLSGQIRDAKTMAGLLYYDRAFR